MSKLPPPMLAHSLVSAHAARLGELARRYGLLERAAARGSDGDAAREAHRALSAQIAAWEVADLEAERRDVVALAAPDRAALLGSVARAIAHAEHHGAGLPPAADEHAVVTSLRRAQADFPSVLPRAALVRLRRSAARLARLEALAAPGFVLGREAEVMLAAIESGTAPIAEGPRGLFDPERGFHGTLVWGMQACLVYEPGAARGVDLGLGASPAVAAVLGIANEDLGAVYRRWVRSADPSHPFARYPYVPRRRLCSVGPERRVRGDLEDAGPVGWASGEEVAILARDLIADAARQPAFAPDLEAASHRVAAAANCGHAVVGLIEYLPPEAEGERMWLTSPEAAEEIP